MYCPVEQVKETQGRYGGLKWNVQILAHSFKIPSKCALSQGTWALLPTPYHSNPPQNYAIHVAAELPHLLLLQLSSSRKYYWHFPFNIFWMKNLKHIEKLNELYNEHSYTRHLDSTVNILLCLPYHAFKVSCRYQYTSPLNSFACIHIID